MIKLHSTVSQHLGGFILSIFHIEKLVRPKQQLQNQVKTKPVQINTSILYLLHQMAVAARAFSPFYFHWSSH
jgi:hypothetical protein